MSQPGGTPTRQSGRRRRPLRELIHSSSLPAVAASERAHNPRASDVSVRLRHRDDTRIFTVTVKQTFLNMG